jgi:uncharacterized membrane protein YedE/YeeE
MKTLSTALVGGLFGFTMSRIGFTSWDLVHGMFTFTNLHLLFTFMMAVTLLTVAWFVIGKASRKQPTMAPRGMHPGILAGGALFGAGWALSGGCPTIVLAQIGEGQLAALVTLGGIVVGNWIYSLVHERWFKWPLTSCLDD